MFASRCAHRTLPRRRSLQMLEAQSTAATRRAQSVSPAPTRTSADLGKGESAATRRSQSLSPALRRETPDTTAHRRATLDLGKAAESFLVAPTTVTKTPFGSSTDEGLFFMYLVPVNRLALCSIWFLCLSYRPPLRSPRLRSGWLRWGSRPTAHLRAYFIGGGTVAIPSCRASQP